MSLEEDNNEPEGTELPEEFWNYRVAESDGPEGKIVAVHEAFYHKGVLDGWTKEPVSPTAPSVEALKTIFQLLLAAATVPEGEEDFFNENTRLEAWLEACDEAVLKSGDGTSGAVFESGTHD